jgi:predicted CXXCH cytochrome family protein
VALWSAQSFAVANVAITKHNLSVSGPGGIKATTETEICVFCHVPHQASTLAPLWNRRNPDAAPSYTPYASSTTKGTMGQPNGSSLLCLSCHDGTIALGELLSRGATKVSMTGVTASGTMPNGTGLIGRDLSDDHPVSFAYTATLAAGSGGELVSPTTLTGKVKLDASGQMQCSSCHDAHDNTNSKFLVMPNTASALCISCHTKAGWSTGSHATSAATWNGLGTNPWLHTSGLTVAANACESCHQPHTAGGKARLLNNVTDEANCYTCHTGNVAGKATPAKNMQTEMTKISGHNVASYSGIHDPTEANVVNSRHVECADCHNPHQTNSSAGTTTAASGFPVLPGSLKGVKGVNISGAAVASVTYEYEVCFRCHGDSSGKKASSITRAVAAGLVGENNVRLEFQTINASFHPVAGVGKSTNVPSLIAPLTTASTITCSSCHSNNSGTGAVGGTGPNGPHGSTISPLLERAYATADNTTDSAAVNALCYKCHDRTKVLATTGNFGRYHNLHNSIGAPCSACHDPHGVSTNNHLINFDTTIVTGARTFTDTGVANKGSCNLTCHGKNHNPFNY